MAHELQWEISFIYDSPVLERFPTVGVIGAGHLARMMVAPAAALGINLIFFAQSSEDPAAQINSHVVGDYVDLESLKKFAQECDVITFEHSLVPLSVIKGLESAGVRVHPSSKAMTSTLAVARSPLTGEITTSNSEIVVIVARSPHNQVSSWTPTAIVREEGICTMTTSPAQGISHEIAERAQKLALEIAAQVGVVGVMAVEMFIKGDQVFVRDIALHPNNSGLWTIDASRTSQFEQHLRAILDLPLGDPAMTNEFAVTGNVSGGAKNDMYRPYLHLMARNPDLKFHQYKNEVRAGREIAHVTAIGSDLLQLITDVQHACEYMSGVIDE